MRLQSRNFLVAGVCVALCAWSSELRAQQESIPPAPVALTTEQVALLEALPERIEGLAENVKVAGTRLAELKADKTLTSRQAEPYETTLTTASEKLKTARETAKALQDRHQLSLDKQGTLAVDLDALDQDLSSNVESKLAELDDELDELIADKAWNDTLQGIPARIEKLEGLVGGLVGRVGQVKGSNTITSKQADQYAAVLSAQAEQLKDAKRVTADLEARSMLDSDEQGDLADDVARVDKQLTAVDATVKAMTEQLADLAGEKGWSLVDKLLEARCATAICFSNGDSKYWLGIEPLVELPVGISSALGNTSLAEYINNHELSIDLAAGLRIWVFDDIVSVSLYLSKPLIEANVRAEGSSFVYPATAVRRSFPGFAIGLFFDSIWIGFDRNELRNGDSDNPMTFNPDFPPNVVVSSAWTITIALQPITAFRTALGTANAVAEED